MTTFRSESRARGPLPPSRNSTSLTTVSDGGLSSGSCYKYRLRVPDFVGNIGYSAVTVDGAPSSPLLAMTRLNDVASQAASGDVDMASQAVSTVGER